MCMSYICCEQWLEKISKDIFVLSNGDVRPMVESKKTPQKKNTSKDLCELISIATPICKLAGLHGFLQVFPYVTGFSPVFHSIS